MQSMRAFVPGAGGPVSPIVPGADDPAVLNGPHEIKELLHIHRPFV